MSVTRIRPRTQPTTELQVLKNRYDEARDIKDAWHYRLKEAQRAHSNAIRTGQDHEATRRNITAVEINFNDAAAQHKTALTAWMDATLHLERNAA